MSATELAIVTAPSLTLLRPIASPADILVAQEEASSLIVKVLKEGIDYGVIPGTKTKPTLLKAGAERLCNAFGLSAEFSIETAEVDHFREIPYTKRSKQWNNAYRGDKSFTWKQEEGASIGLYRYVVQCDLRLRTDGRKIGSGIGVCSTLESKYIDRPRDCENTVLKMAEKRALVAAVLIALGLSDRFTQDVEDFREVDHETGEVLEGQIVDEPKKTVEKKQPSETAKANAEFILNIYGDDGRDRITDWCKANKTPIAEVVRVMKASSKDDVYPVVEDLLGMMEGAE